MDNILFLYDEYSEEGAKEIAYDINANHNEYSNKAVNINDYFYRHTVTAFYKSYSEINRDNFRWNYYIDHCYIVSLLGASYIIKNDDVISIDKLYKLYKQLSNVNAKVILCIYNLVNPEFDWLLSNKDVYYRTQNFQLAMKGVYNMPYLTLHVNPCTDDTFCIDIEEAIDDLNDMLNSFDNYTNTKKQEVPRKISIL